MRKKFLHSPAFAWALAALLMLLMLAGCGASGGDASGNASSATTTDQPPAQMSQDEAQAPASTGGKQALASADKIKIVAAENFYGEVAEAVGGEQAEVVSILTNPADDPHDFEPTPEASKAVQDAQLVIYNGIGYDEWMTKLVGAASDASAKTVIAVGSDVMGKQAGDNEHVWYNPQTMPRLADQLAQQLGELDPAHRDTYRQRAEAYTTALAPFTDLAQELKQASPVPIAVSEPVFDYMAEALNLEVTDEKFEMAAEEETDPAPADLAQLQDDIKDKKIRMFVNNIQASSPTVQTIAKLAQENNIPVIEVTETLPAGKNYITWMTDQLNQIKDALAAS